MRDRSPLARRLRTVPLLYLGLLVTWVTLPVLLTLAAIVDVVRWLGQRTPFMASRLVLFLLAYLTAEAIGVFLLGAGWIAAGFGRSESRMFQDAFAIQKAWAGFVFWAVRTLFRLTVRSEGTESVAETPFILLARHTSIVDNLLPSHFISRPHGVHVRYVMKDELLADPALDIAGNRLPNYFVRRGAGEGERETAAIRRVAETLGTNEGVLIYPEGTRFTRKKRERALRSLERRNPELHERASTWTRVLPPRPGGTLALLEGSDADILILAHRGLDGFAQVADIWRGAMVGTQIDVAFWRIPRADVPEGRANRTRWLYDIWERLDRWVAGDDDRRPTTDDR